MLNNNCRKILRALLNEQYKAQRICEFIGSKEKDKYVLLKRFLRRRLYAKNHIIIGMNTIVGKNITFPHPQNIVIGDGVVIGNNVVIYQDVTIGVQDREQLEKYSGRLYPKINDNVCIYAGAKVVGSICIEENCIIGSNAVVLRNTEKNGVYGGAPARLLRMRDVSKEVGGY